MTPRIGWLDCSAGASGDMLLGALVDAGVSLEALQDAVDGLHVERIVLSAQSVQRRGLRATSVEVKVPETQTHRSWADVQQILLAAELAEPVREVALEVFGRLARAESRAHGVAEADVHFHEVGALDALADVVATVAGFQTLDLGRVTASPVAVGAGAGLPAPAVLTILGEVSAPVFAGVATHEACTPTGAALLATLARDWSALPPMHVAAVGLGAGSRDVAEVANVVRLVIGESVTNDLDADALLFEANIDDMDPRLWPAVLQTLLDAGASDAWLTPIVMKKGRPAHTLSVLVDEEHAADVRNLIFRETSTIGLRAQQLAKHALDREAVTIKVQGCRIRVKVARVGGVVVNASPEYDDVAAAARRLNQPVKQILAAAIAAIHDAGLAS